MPWRGVSTGVEFVRSCARFVVPMCVVLVMSASDGFAQNERSYWGASVSGTPAWDTAQQVKDLLGDEGDVIEWKGKEFTIGFVRGSTLGGDLGVSYVRKPF